MTGYERAENMELFYAEFADGTISSYKETYHIFDDNLYNMASYYTSKRVADNNARADKLMRQLRRFAIENRNKNVDWNNYEQPKYLIHYNYFSGEFTVEYYYYERALFCICFDTMETAKKAIEKFEEELLWYFTEYKDSCGLPGSKEPEPEEPEIHKFSIKELIDEIKRRKENAKQNEKENK